MPLLTFERNSIGKHPIVDEFVRDDIATFWGPRRFVKPSCGHLGVDVLLNIVEITFREPFVDLIGCVPCHIHRLDVEQLLLGRLLLVTQEGFLES